LNWEEGRRIGIRNITGAPPVALNIKNTETEKLARELARRRKQSITQAVTEVLRREVERERKRPRREDTAERLRRIEGIVQEVKTLPILDDRTADEVLGYDDQGLFD
jgi:antitoxin VapB